MITCLFPFAPVPEEADGKIKAAQKIFEQAEMQANQHDVGELHGQVKEADELLPAARRGK